MAWKSPRSMECKRRRLHARTISDDPHKGEGEGEKGGKSLRESPHLTAALALPQIWGRIVVGVNRRFSIPLQESEKGEVSVRGMVKRLQTCFFSLINAHSCVNLCNQILFREAMLYVSMLYCMNKEVQQLLKAAGPTPAKLAQSETGGGEGGPDTPAQA